jgi:hypothetical protein
LVAEEPTGGVVRVLHQAKQKWLLANMSNEDEQRWRCAAAKDCTKLFKSADFLQKHLLNKHGHALEDSLRQVCACVCVGV